MKLFDEQHLERVAQHAFPLYENGPPPDDGEVGSKMLSYLVALERTLSPKAARAESGLSMLGYEDCTYRSAWFCRMVNSIAAFSQDEAVWTAISRANGHTKADETGAPVKDADGKVLKFGVSEVASKMVVEDRLRTAQVVQLPRESGQPGEQPDFNSLNREDHRQLQVAECRRALLSLQPQVDAGDRQAIDTMVKVQDRLAKLLGTDQPRLIANFNTVDNISRLSDEELIRIATHGLTLVKGADGTYSDEKGNAYELGGGGQ